MHNGHFQLKFGMFGQILAFDEHELSPVVRLFPKAYRKDLKLGEAIKSAAFIAFRGSGLLRFHLVGGNLAVFPVRFVRVADILAFYAKRGIGFSV
jgi:hypothetical protein